MVTVGGHWTALGLCIALHRPVLNYFRFCRVTRVLVKVQQQPGCAVPAGDLSGAQGCRAVIAL
jgi:hypothetical protein